MSIVERERDDMCASTDECMHYTCNFFGLTFRNTSKAEPFREKESCCCVNWV